MEPLLITIALSTLFLQGHCDYATPQCLWNNCCEAPGDSCTIQPQALQCDKQQNGYDCWDMGNNGCHRHIQAQKTKTSI